MEPDVIIMSAIGGCCCLSLLLAVLLVIVGTLMKWRIGVNLMGAKCYKCGEPAPFVRAPTDGYEMMWGGWTCTRCGKKNDKWGNKR